MAKKYMLDHWKQYDVVDSRQEMLELLNCLQACGETLESMHDCVQDGDSEWCDCVSWEGWSSMRDLKDTIFYFCSFYTESEFIDYIIDQFEYFKIEVEDLEKYPWQDPAERIRCLTSDDPKDFCDTQISKTEDGYVVRIWC